MTNAKARFSNSLRPRKPDGLLGQMAQDVHLDSHTAAELCDPFKLLSHSISMEKKCQNVFSLQNSCNHFSDFENPLTA